MEPETTTPNTCGSCDHEHEVSNACAAEGCNCGADATADEDTSEASEIE